MIVDTSAIVAIACAEPHADVLSDLIARDREPLMSAANFLETSIVLERRRSPAFGAVLDVTLREHGIVIAPVMATHADIARVAYRQYGRGSGHPAKLNFGDCFAYALAVEQGQPLLWIGDDFDQTDVVPAWRP